MPSLSVAARNALLNGLVAAVGASPTVEVRTGAEPAITDSDSGTLLVTFSLGSSWAESAAEGAVAFTTSSSGGGPAVVATATAAANGVAGHFRLKSSGGSVYVSGSVSENGGGGDVVLDSVSIIAGISVSITSWFLYTPSS